MSGANRKTSLSMVISTSCSKMILLILLQLCIFAEASKYYVRGGGVAFANKFPTLNETVEMARLSRLVYEFRDKEDDFCKTYSRDNGVRCEWYYHNKDVGTQVLIVSNWRLRQLAVVFAGTDDLRTSLEDVNISKMPFGNNSTVSIKNKDIKVHAGFDNAVFSHSLYETIYSKVKSLKRRHPFYALWTTGHSLGAANSILMGTALAMDGYSVTSINFGCPRTGNEYWRDYFNSTSPLKSRLRIWRVVVGSDLVARLPEFFYHVGHTIQIWNDKDEKSQDNSTTTKSVVAYYEHYGSPEQGYAGVPPGWYAKSYEWVPSALISHHINTYIEHLDLLQESNIFVEKFQEYEPIGYDDDEYDEPPDDWYRIDSSAANENLHLPGSESAIA